MTQPILETDQLSLYYDRFQALINVCLKVEPRKITSIIGPSGCGKSTLLRVFNRMNDVIENVRTEGKVLLEGREVYGPGADILELRKRVGMVFQRPNPFPLSVYENIIFGIKIHGAREGRGKAGMDAVVERSLRSVLLWEVLKDKLHRRATALSLEQQQRLCIARALVMKPAVLLMDEPCSALDPVSTARIEELMQELKKEYTLVIVTHNMQQAARVSDDTGYMLLGELVEFGATRRIFTNPRDKRTEDYVTGRLG